jgi:phage gpG-like protein
MSATTSTRGVRSDKVAGRVVIVDRKAYSRSVSEVFGTRPAAVKVGVFGAKGDEVHKSDKGSKAATITNVEVATIHEFGLGVPERSFLRAYVDGNESRIRLMFFVQMQRLIRDALEHARPITDSDRTRVLSRVALKIVGEVQGRIKDGIAPPLAESTIRQKTVNGKRGTTPLIDTGQLRSSIGFAVSLDGKWGGK